jgi:hypothetical protein
VDGRIAPEFRSDSQGFRDPLCLPGNKVRSALSRTGGQQ